VTSPSGRLPATWYSNALTFRRGIADMDLRSNGGITYQYTTADDVTFPFGWGLSFSWFSFDVLTRQLTTSTDHLQAQHVRGGRAMAEASHYNTSAAGFEADFPSYLINVTNQGPVESAVTVSRPFPSWNRPMLTEIYLWHACSDHEIEDGNGRAGARLRHRH
jgi:hypothetical protein